MSGTPGTIAILRVNQHRNEEDLHAARAAHHPAVVVAVEGEGVTLLNAWRFASPWGPPVLQVPMDAWPSLERARLAGGTVRIVCGATRVPTQALNLTARIPGTNSDVRPSPFSLLEVAGGTAPVNAVAGSPCCLSSPGSSVAHHSPATCCSSRQPLMNWDTWASAGSSNATPPSPPHLQPGYTWAPISEPRALSSLFEARM